jgi:hypothetical protein
MPDFPLWSPGLAHNTAFGNTAAVGSATPNVKGSWAEIVAATAHDADGLLLVVTQSSSAALSHLLDFGVGGAGSETVILPDWLVSIGARMTAYTTIPIDLPAGSRIAARCQGSGVSNQLQVRAMTLRGGLLSTPPAGQVIAIGVNSADSGGQVIDPGATTNTYGAWTELTASTTVDIVAVRVCLGMRENAGPVGSVPAYYVDLGVGAAASEQSLIEALPFSMTASGDFGAGGPHFWLPVSIPAGSRIAARARAGTNDATDRLFDLSLLALTA